MRLILLLGIGVIACGQTSSRFVYNNLVTCTQASGGACQTYLYPGSGTVANNPTLIMLNGGAWINLNGGCPGRRGVAYTCPLVTLLNNNSINVLDVDYPVTSDSGVTWDLEMKALKGLFGCIVAGTSCNAAMTIDRHKLYVYGTSAGGHLAGIMALSANAKWLTDSNAQCQFCGTDYKVLGVFINSGENDLCQTGDPNCTNDPNAYVNTCGIHTLCNTLNLLMCGASSSTTVFTCGNSFMAAAANASPNNYVSDWLAKDGYSPIVVYTSTNDNQIAPQTQALLGTMIRGSGKRLIEVIGATTGHGWDAACLGPECANWPSNLTLTASWTGANCINLSPCGPQGVIATALLAMIQGQYDAINNGKSGSAGGSRAAGGSW